MNTVEEIYNNNRHRERVFEDRRTRDVLSLRKSVEKKNSEGKLGLIAEFKKESPSGFRAESLRSVTDYFSKLDRGLAAGYSVLTEPTRFSGSWDDLSEAQKFDTPLLAKDFFQSENMIHDAYLSGADAVLLIADFLATGEMRSLMQSADKLGMDVLIEFHDIKCAERIPVGDNVLIGYNRRNLRTMIMEGMESEAKKRVGDVETPFILESGIDASNAATLDFSGFSGLLIGSSIISGDSVLGVLRRRCII